MVNQESFYRCQNLILLIGILNLAIGANSFYLLGLPPDAKISQFQKELRSTLLNSRYAGYPSYPIMIQYVPESQDKIGIHASNYYLRAKKDKEVLGLAKSGSDNDLEKLSTFIKLGHNVVVVDG